MIRSDRGAGVRGGACSTWPVCDPSGGCKRRAERQALQEARRSSDLVLGEDGRVHYGNVMRKMSGTILSDVICGVVPLRAIGPRERWWVREPRRVCSMCITDLCRHAAEATPRG